jgi:hypothetical protein
VTLLVSSGGVAGATTLNGGTEIVSAGGKIVGAVTMTGFKNRLSAAGMANTAFAVSGFGATDTLDLASFAFKASEKLSFVENKAKTKGVLTVTDGSLKATITLFGQYVAAGFHLAGDHAAGTTIVYVPPAAHSLDIAARGT